MDTLFKEILELYGINIENTNTEDFLEVLEAAGLELMEKDGFVSVGKIDTYEDIVKEVEFDEAFDQNFNNTKTTPNSTESAIGFQKKRLFQNDFLNSHSIGMDLTGMSLEEVLKLTEEFEVVDMFVTEDGNLETQPRPERAGKIKIYSEEEARAERDRIAALKEEIAAMEEFGEEFIDEAIEKIEESEEESVKEMLRENISEWLEEQNNRLNELIDSFSEKMNQKVAYQLS